MYEHVIKSIYIIYIDLITIMAVIPFGFVDFSVAGKLNEHTQRNQRRTNAININAHTCALQSPIINA